jgi:hypothetical protein
VLEDRVKRVPAAVKVAAADAARRRAVKAQQDEVAAAAPEPAPAPAAAADQPQPQTVALASAAPSDAPGGIWGSSTQNVKRWLHLGGQEPDKPAVTAYVPDQPIPTDVPLPPRRDAAVGESEKPVHVALHAPQPPVKPKPSDDTAATPPVVQ